MSFSQFVDTHLPTLGSVRAPAWRVPKYGLGTWKASKTRRRALLRVIAIAAEERLALAPLIEALAWDERGRQHRRLRRLALALQKGVSLPDALERFPGLLSDEQMLLVRYGSESGMLAPVIRQRIEDENRNTQLASSNLQGVGAYLGVFFFLSIPIALFFQTAIVPELQKILEEFGIGQSPTVLTAMGIARWLSSLWWVALIALPVLAWGRMFSWPGRVLRNAVAPYFLKPLKSWRVADVLEKLGQSAERGRPLAGALATLARYHFDPSLRHKLLFIRNELELGGELWPSFVETGLISPEESKAVQLADRLNDRGWSLKRIAEARRDRIHHRVARLAVMITPTLALLLGAYVLANGLALLLPLISLLDANL